MAVSLLSSCKLFLQDSRASMATKAFPVASRVPAPILYPNLKSSLYGCPLLIRGSSQPLQAAHRARSLSVRCEQSTKGGSGVDVWLGRLAMVGFAAAISVEIATGKGLLEIRGLWKHYFQNTQGVIFVVDSVDRGRISEARTALHRILSENDLQDAALLVIANKQDLPNAMHISEVAHKLALHLVQVRRWYIQGASAITGNGLYDGLEWLSNNIALKQV